MLSYQLKKSNEITIPCDLKQYVVKRDAKILGKEYSLKINMFDPSKSSPPNNFMVNLRERMKVYSEK